MKPSALSESWERELAPLGFGSPGAREALCRGDLCLSEDGGWPVFSSETPYAGDLLVDPMGRPGLWRIVPGRQPRRVFELPPTVLAATAGDDDTRRSPLQALTAWAVETLDGTPPGDWQPPARERIEAAIPRLAMTVSSGPHARQVSLLDGRPRLAFRVPLVTALSAELSSRRRVWLRRILRATLRRWRLVRVGLGEGRSLEAEVDLTGAPVELTETLVPVALVALRYAVTWCLASIAFVVDARNLSLALDGSERGVESKQVRAEPKEERS